VFIILGNSLRITLFSKVILKIEASDSFTIIYIIIGILGFVLGNIAYRRNIYQSILNFLAAFSIPILVGAFMLNAFSNRIAFPHSLKLGDCTNSVLRYSFETARGHGYFLTLYVPKSQSMLASTNTISSFKFTGNLRISTGGNQLVDMALDSDRAWLTDSSYVLTGLGSNNTNSPPLDNYMRSHNNYDLEIILNPPPPSGSSMWMSWKESKMDK